MHTTRIYSVSVPYRSQLIGSTTRIWPSGSSSLVGRKCHTSWWPGRQALLEHKWVRSSRRLKLRTCSSKSRKGRQALRKKPAAAKKKTEEDAEDDKSELSDPPLEEEGDDLEEEEKDEEDDKEEEEDSQQKQNAETEEQQEDEDGKQKEEAEKPRLKTYLKMKYKNSLSFGLRQTFGAKSQAFCLGGKQCSMTKDQLAAIADEAIVSMQNGSMSEEQACQAAKAKLV